MTTPEPIHDRRDQLEQVQSGLLQGERLFAVYDAKGVGTGYIALTDRRVIIADKSFVGRAVALVSMPYSQVASVAVLSNAKFTGNFFSTSGVIVTSSGGVVGRRALRARRCSQLSRQCARWARVSTSGR